MKQKNLEPGRSMVEMLGALAIMGVLSVGAIAGFNYAMNKHRTNEILDEARKRAYTVMTQTQLGLTQSLSEYSRHNTFAGGTFGSDIVTEGLTGQFGLEVTGVLGRVCNNLKDTVSENTIIRKIKVNGTDDGDCDSEGNALVLVYNNDMSQVDLTTGGDPETPVTPPTPETPATPTCPTGTSAEGLGGYATTLADTDHTRCYCDTKDTVYDSTNTTTPCPAKSGTICASYKDCNKGEYCQFSPGSCSGDNITIPTTGVCKDVTPCGLYNVGTTGWVASDYGGSCSPNWFTAKDICESQGMSMPSLSDVGCEDYKDSMCPTTGTTFGTLKDAGLLYAFWTTDLYTNSPTSCRAWFVHPGILGCVRSGGRNSDNYGVFLCRP